MQIPAKKCQKPAKPAIIFVGGAKKLYNSRNVDPAI
jgi:hypothetical protein